MPADITWHCHPLHDDMPAAAVAGGVAVVIDVLRASTTIVTALAEGAAFVLPTSSVAEAQRQRQQLPPGTLLGGERGGVRIAGFDLGNSPAEYTPLSVAGRGVVITTTNGTAALARCAAASERLIGCLVNRGAVAAAAVRLAAAGNGQIHLVCAGTDGEVTDEDLLGAGGILAAAAELLPVGSPFRHDLAGGAALAAYRSHVSAADPTASLVKAFTAAPGGANLVELGMAADLPLAAAVDRFGVVPRLCPQTGHLMPLIASGAGG
ncbi:MAG: putative 2-phosphosulfolactate phosphatase [Planctomycetota bacterium]